MCVDKCYGVHGRDFRQRRRDVILTRMIDKARKPSTTPRGVFGRARKPFGLPVNAPEVQGG